MEAAKHILNGATRYRTFFSITALVKFSWLGNLDAAKQR